MNTISHYIISVNDSVSNNEHHITIKSSKSIVETLIVFAIDYLSSNYPDTEMTDIVIEKDKSKHYLSYTMSFNDKAIIIEIIPAEHLKLISNATELLNTLPDNTDYIKFDNNQLDVFYQTVNINQKDSMFDIFVKHYKKEGNRI